MNATVLNAAALKRPATSHLLLAVFLVFAVFCIMLLCMEPALAKNSLGIGGSEQAIRPTGMFAGILETINDYQQDFYNSLRKALISIRDSGAGFWLLVSVSFAYGVFHAAGPGHGKAIVASYMIANEVAAKRGIALALVSSLLQAMTAIVIMAALTLFLRGTGIRSNDVSGWLATFSYVAITALGAWLLWTKLRGSSQSHGHGHGHAHNHDHSHSHDHHHDGNEPCPTCGHMHMPDPKTLSGKLDLKTAASAVIAVGIRPCSGALVVLAFAFINGLYMAGIVSTLAMGLGTAITVSILAILSVWAKDIAIRLTRSEAKTATIHRIIEIAGAALVFLIGLMLLLADLYG